jgi:sugar phosphate isomerase/epimerase
VVGIVIETLNGAPWSFTAADLERSARGAAEGGFREVSLGGGHVVKMGAIRARAILDNAGLTVCSAEWRSSWKHGAAGVIESAEKGLEVLGILGTNLMIANVDAEPMEFPRAAEGYAALCERAARHGMRVALEFIPPWSPTDLPAAWRLIQEAGAANGGIVIDMMHWHYQKDGGDLHLLRSIPGDRIFYVQLCDAAYPRMPADKDYITVATTARLLPGEGRADVAKVLATLSDMGADPVYAAEVYNDQLAALGPVAMARRVREASEKLFANLG